MKISLSTRRLLPVAALPLLAVPALLLGSSIAPAQQNQTPQDNAQAQPQTPQNRAGRRQGQGQNAGKRQGQGQNRQGQRNGQRRNGQGNAQNPGNNAGGQGDATAFAQVEGAGSKKRVQVPPVDAPRDVPVQISNYPIPAGAIWASPDAKAGGKGTQNSPMGLRQAIQRAPLGGTVVLAGGLYREGDLAIPRQMTVQAAPGARPILDGSDIVSGWVADGDAWRRDGWETLFPTALSPENIDPQYPLSNNRDMVWIEGKYQTQVGSREEVAPGKFWVDYQGKKLFIGENPTGKLVEATTRSNGFSLPHRNIDLAQGSAIRGLGIQRFADAGVEVQLSRTVLEGNSISWNGNYGVQIRSAGAPKPPSDVVLRGNNLSCNGQNGVRAFTAERLVAENNLISHNNIENYRRNWGAAGIKVMKASGTIFRNNVVKNNYSFGFWMDENLNDATVVGNKIEGNEVAGIMFEISHRALIAFNTVHDNNVGLMVSNSTQGQIWNNTFADNKIGAVIKQGRRLNHQTEDPKDFFLTRDIALQNNLFAQTKPKAGNTLLDLGSGAGQAPEMVTALDSNLYVLAAPATLAKWQADGKKNDFTDLASLQGASAQEKRSVQIAMNPFANAAQGDFRPKAGVLNVQPEALPAEVAKAAGVAPGVGYVGALSPAA